MERLIQMFASLPHIAIKSPPHISIPSITYDKFLALLYGPHKRDDEVHNLLIVVQPKMTVNQRLERFIFVPCSSLCKHFYTDAAT